MGITRRFDAFQRRHRWAGLPIAVVYKFVDDQGAYLAALLTYYGFLSLFPLLLLGVTVLGYVLHDDPAAQQAVLSSALRNVPVIGDQIRDNVHEFSGSTAGLVVGVVVAVYGALGVTQAAQHALDEVWAVPRAERPSIWAAYGRGALVVLLVGIGMVTTAGLSALATAAGETTGLGGLGRGAATVAGVVVNIGLFLMAYHLLPARRSRVRDHWIGAVTAGVTWQVLLTVGTWLVGTRLQGASASYGLFGIVLGLLGFLYLAALVTLLCAEVNVVRARRLWPRSLLTPFTDNVELTHADQRSYRDLAAMQKVKGFEDIDVRFHPQREDSDPQDERPASR